MIDLDKELMTQKMKVDFNTYDLSVKELLSMVNDGLINIAPDYQRQFRWDDERQSSLIIFRDTCTKSIYGNKCRWNLGIN